MKYKNLIIRICLFVLPFTIQSFLYAQTNNTFQVTLLKGIVTDKISAKPLGVKIELYDALKNEFIGEYLSNSETGKYLISLHPGKTYRLLFILKKYFIHEEIIEITAEKYKEIKKDVAMELLEPNVTKNLGNVQFVQVADSFNVSVSDNLDIIEKLMQINTKLQIEIGGINLKADTNQTTKLLLAAKTKAVYNNLVQRGITVKRLQKRIYLIPPVAEGYIPTDKMKSEGIRFQYKIIKK